MQLYKFIYKLNFWQKGIATKVLGEEYSIDKLSSNEILSIQSDKLRKLMHYCNENCPFYRERFKTYAVDLEAMDIFSELKKMPPILKEDITSNISEIIPKKYQNKKGLTKKATGGSTGTPLVIWGDDEDYRKNGVVIARQRSWIGWYGGMRTLTLFGGFRDIPSQLRRQVKKLVLNEKLINIMDRNNADYDDLANQIVTFKPKVIIGYFSLLQEIGAVLKRKKIKVDSLKLIIAAAEPLNEVARLEVESAFGTPVYFQYGNRELGTFAQECTAQQGYHYAQDHYLCEVLDDDNKDVDYGKLTITYFDNLVTPLLRYQIGDGASLTSKQCKCGLPYHRLSVIDGRLASMIRLPSGKKITSNIFPHIFKDYLWIKEFQVEQVSQSTLVIRINKESSFFSEVSFIDVNAKIIDLIGSEIDIEWKYDEPFIQVPTGKHVCFIESIEK